MYCINKCKIQSMKSYYLLKLGLCNDKGSLFLQELIFVVLSTEICGFSKNNIRAYWTVFREEFVWYAVFLLTQ